MSPAVPPLLSGGSYTDDLPLLLATSLAARIVSLESFTVSPTTRIFEGFKCP